MNSLASNHFRSSHLSAFCFILFRFMSIDSKQVHLFPWCLQGITDTRRHLPDTVSRVPLLGGSLSLCGAPPTHSRGPHTARTSVPGQPLPPHLSCQSCSRCLSLLSACPPACLPARLPACLSVCLSGCTVCQWLSVSLSVAGSCCQCSQHLLCLLLLLITVVV